MLSISIISSASDIHNRTLAGFSQATVCLKQGFYKTITMQGMRIGIDAISFYIPSYHLDLSDLAIKRGLKADRFLRDLGQERMAVCPPCEDTVTLGIHATLQILDQLGDLNTFSWILWATETGVDQSKAAGLYAHNFLNFSKSCRVLEIKQACYSATGAIQLAKAFVQTNPREKVLVIASDIAKYEQGSLGEPTQGCGAVAMVIAANPRILALDPYQGSYSNHVMDFWRPNYLEYAVVSNKYSVKNYFEVLEQCWGKYQQASGLSFNDVDYSCYHTPFTKMADRVHGRFQALHHSPKAVGAPMIYNRYIGNAYTASLYISFCALLDYQNNLENKRIGFFSYGSGCVAEYFSGIIQPGYQKFLKTTVHQNLLKAQEKLSYEQYLECYNYQPQDAPVPSSYQSGGNVRFCGIEKHQRIYKRVPC